MTEHRHVHLRGSEKTAPAGRRMGPVPDEEPIEISLYLRPSAPLPTPGGPAIGRTELASRHGADPGDLAKVTEFAAEYGLQVVESDAARRRVALAGPAGNLAKAFQVPLDYYEIDGVKRRCRHGGILIPAELDGIVTGVFGLDDRPQAKPHFRSRAAAATSGFTGKDVAGFYEFPPGTGAGECIALVELGGGYRQSDLDSYFAPLGGTPTVVAVSVDGAGNQPTGNADSADGEVVLDIEVAGAAAPGARIAAYFAPNTDRGFIDAVSQAVHDTTNAPSVISISWGSAENGWTAQSTTALDEAFQAAAAAGITVCVAAGDNGSGDNVGDGAAHVDFPASSPHVLACGGTNLKESGGTITAETVWNDPGGGATGGGISTVFPLPSWQDGAGVPVSVNPGGGAGRGVPDIAGVADPSTGYSILVDGQTGIFGGTSAVAPLWAALVAILNQTLGKPVGFLNPVLYANPSALNDIIQGNNIQEGGPPGYSAGSGWDACTGLGSPNGAAILAVLQAPTPAS